jgi:hypothetical protein
VIDLLESWLRSDGDPAGAALWRRWCELLAGPVRIGVAGRETGIVARTAARIGACAVPIVVEGIPGPGVQDRLLGVHAIAWATPVTSALGAEERETLASLEALGAPGARWIALADQHLLERVADDPPRELAEVRARVDAVASWPLVDDPSELADRLERDPDLRSRRFAEVARVLMADARARSSADLARADAEIARVSGLLDGEDAQLDAVLRAASRSAAHLLGAVRRQIELLLVDLDDFLVALERGLPAEIDATLDVDLARRALPHWLQQVVEGWLSDRLAAAQAALVVDLQGVVEASELDRISLVLPLVHPGEVRGEAQWGARLGATAALGSGAALLLLGLWIPGLAAIAGGAVWSAVGQGARVEATRARLVETGTSAIRRLGVDASTLLREQLEWIGREADRIGPERREEARAQRADVRASLERSLAAAREERTRASDSLARWAAREST